MGGGGGGPRGELRPAVCVYAQVWSACEANY